jgi:hypothetical protein
LLAFTNFTLFLIDDFIYGLGANLFAKISIEIDSEINSLHGLVCLALGGD